MPTASSHRRNTWVCLASSNANCVRYISSPSRPSARIAAMNGWMSWVTASSPAMNSRAQPGGPVAFQVGQRFPVLPVAGEVDVGRIPELGVAPGEQLQRQAVPVEAARGE